MEHLDRKAASEGAEISWRTQLIVRPGLLEIIVAAFMALLALWLWADSYSFASGGRGLMGPAAFPRGVALLLGITSFVMGFRGVRYFVGRLDGGEAVVFRRPGPLLRAAVLIVLYPLLLTHFGFYVTTGVWMLALLWVIGQRNPIWGVVTGLCFLLAVKLAFQMAMGIPLP
jgi:putative tricarboxylic transport membrane protein